MMRILIIAASLFIDVSASAQPYKWVDANGRVQYTDQPPPGAKKAEPVKNRIGSATGQRRPHRRRVLKQAPRQSRAAKPQSR